MAVSPPIYPDTIHEDKPLTLGIFFKLLVNAYLLGFIAYITIVIIRKGNDVALQQFVNIRNYIYTGFAALMVIIAFYTMLNGGKSKQNVWQTEVLPQAIIGLIVTTFTYAIANFLVKFLFLLNLL